MQILSIDSKLLLMYQSDYNIRSSTFTGVWTKEKRGKGNFELAKSTYVLHLKESSRYVQPS